MSSSSVADRFKLDACKPIIFVHSTPAKSKSGRYNKGYLSCHIPSGRLDDYLAPHNLRGVKLLDFDALKRPGPGTTCFIGAGGSPLCREMGGFFKVNFGLKLDLNTAASFDLHAVPGIGPGMAKRILQYRNTTGGFISLDQLLEVKGIGKKTLLKIKPFLSVDGTDGD